ncbi:MAG: dTDP-4-dehydrorhamnose 3,5-epimerase, partial [Belnapia sp.]|nr:dTDP-4-dehydrorhamnose 3,5-epimerase [Belnapia sp.]
MRDTTSTATAGDSRVAGNFTARRYALAGPVLVASRRFGDHRGFFLETYSARDFAELGIADVFVQDNHSLSAQ